jgi:endonuclease/exonuclease/phosphatase family metal-dependent hydrolase
MVGLACLLGSLSLNAQTGTFIDRQLSSDLRMMSYNILWDSIFPDVDAVKAAKFNRVMDAINPDILNLQEIGYWDSPVAPKTGNDVRDLLNSVSPLPDGASWNVYKGNSGDSVLASKYPITMTRNFTSPSGDLGMAIGLVNLPDDQFPSDFYVMNNHYKCCGGNGSTEDQRRQRQSDANVAWLRDARNPGGVINLAPGTPFAVVGDLNIVGSQSPLNTLITGNIVNEASYGVDSPPDWDGTNITDAAPVHNGSGSLNYTYRSGGSTSRLDYIIYSDSALDVGNKFVLNTVSMIPAQRTATGLQQFDTAQGNSSTYFDHLPVVVDFRLFDFAEADFNYSRGVDATDLAIWQNSSGMASGATRTMGDADGDGDVDGRDFLVWQRQVAASAPEFASVPEPTGFVLLLSAVTVVPLSRKRRVAA